MVHSNPDGLVSPPERAVASYASQHSLHTMGESSSSTFTSPPQDEYASGNVNNIDVRHPVRPSRSYSRSSMSVASGRSSRSGSQIEFTPQLQQLQQHSSTSTSSTPAHTAYEANQQMSSTSTPTATPTSAPALSKKDLLYNYPDFYHHHHHHHNHRTRDRTNSDASTASSTTSSTIYRSQSWYSKIPKSKKLVYACLKALALFLICLAAVIISVKSLLPPIDPKDAPFVKIPKNFEDLKNLNSILQVYKDEHFSRVLSTFIVIYLFLQAFSLPGSMYLSILAGAMFGVFRALVLVCFCVATGASMCYGISALIGPDILATSAKWRERVDSWGDRVRRQGGNVISYLIVLRIAPLPPHWVINLVAPHLAISFSTFYISTFVGVMGVSFIHTQIGTALDQMSSPEDFHLISWRNFFGLAGVVFAALVPVALRMRWRNELEEASGETGGIRLPTDTSILPRSRSSTVSSQNGQQQQQQQQQPHVQQQLSPTSSSHRNPRHHRGSSGKLLIFMDDDTSDDAESMVSLARSGKSDSGPGPSAVIVQNQSQTVS